MALVEAPAMKQDDVEEFLADPANYTDGSTVIDVIRTHGAIVFLGKRDVYKIKQAVFYDYMDFSTLAKRRHACEREHALNAKVAPQIYRKLVTITREVDGSLALDGGGEIVEVAVLMNRFREQDVLNEVAGRGDFDAPLASSLGEMLSHYHQALPPTELDENGLHSAAAVQMNIAGNLAKQACLQGPALNTYIDEGAALAGALVTPLHKRWQASMVRRGHGDLHLKNIVLLDGVPTPFDALEFREDFATTDVLYDFAFLIMDMLYEGLNDQAIITFNRYVECGWSLMEVEGFAVLPLYLSLRAAIRAMVSAQTAALNPAKCNAMEREARRYLTLANQLRTRTSPCLLAIGGLSGTGKSTLARSLAAEIGKAPGAVILRSDRERKQMFGKRDHEALPSEAYQREVSIAVYGRLLEKAEIALRQGHAVILDAVYARDHERQEAEALADQVGVTFQGLWLDGPTDVLMARVDARTGDASDADSRVVKQQIERHSTVKDALGPRWQVVNAGGSAEETKTLAGKALYSSLGGGPS